MKLGIDIGGTKVCAGLFDDSVKLMEKISARTAEIPSLADWIADAAGRLSANYERPDFCGIGVPGTVSGDGMKIIKVPNADIPTDLCSEVAKRLGVLCLAVQDSRAAAWGEYVCGAGKGAGVLVCVTLGTGIGTGIIIDGKIYPGAFGAAGELGHIPCPTLSASAADRKCGCGKTGCTEKYAAGGGLDLTARENGFADSKELLDAAEGGDEKASALAAEAVEILGRTMVGAVNLLNPDALLFSGGLSSRKIVIEPLIAYINEHCYSTDRKTFVGTAALGSESPLYGAAMIQTAFPENVGGFCKKKGARLAVSIMCGDFLDLGRQLAELERATACFSEKDAECRTLIHCDIMDNHFVPNLMLPPEFCGKIRRGTGLSFDYHIMCEKPETVIERLDIREGDIVSVHAESTVHLQRMLALVKSKGASAAVAINPATPLTAVEEVIDDVDMILVMTVNPGFAGQKLVPRTLEKVSALRKKLDEAGKFDISIEVDGNCSFEHIPEMYSAGADTFVVGSSSLFSDKETISSAARKIFESLK